MRMQIATALAVVVYMGGLAFAGSPMTRVYDVRGRSVGTVTTDSQGTKRFRDERGRSIGSASTEGNTTTFRDERGRVIGRERR